MVRQFLDITPVAINLIAGCKLMRKCNWFDFSKRLYKFRARHGAKLTLSNLAQSAIL